MQATFSRRYPLISLDLTFTGEVVDLVEKRLDLTVRPGKVDSPNLIAGTLLSWRRGVCTSPGYLQKVRFCYPCLKSMLMDIQR